MNDCPTPEDLERALKGKTSEDVFVCIDAHLKDCMGCRRIADAIMQKNPPVKLLAPIRASAIRDSADVRRKLQKDALSGQDFGDFQLLEEIARGGMGIVYKARQRKPDRIVALKLILSGNLASKEDIDRFESEANSAGKLDHPNIVPVFQSGEVNGQHYIAMGYVEDAHSLADLLKNTPLSPSKAAQLLKSIANAIDHAHSHGVIHRDIKPSNILIVSDSVAVQEAVPFSLADSTLQYVPRVTDFGLAKRIQSDPGDRTLPQVTGTGQILGTPSYMPPEQAKGEEADQRSDVYGLGATLYSLLTGHPPFQTDNPYDTISQLCKDDPVRPRQLNPKLPRDLETICLKCLEKERICRYQTASELEEDLDRFLKGKPTRARPLGRVTRYWRWYLRNRWKARAAALFVLLLISAALYGLARLESLRRELAIDQAEVQRQKQENYRDKANIILDAIGHSDEPATRNEIEAFWRLSQSPREVRYSFLKQALASPGSARRFSNRSAIAAQSAVALDTRLRTKVATELIRPRLRDENAEIKFAAAQLGIELDLWHDVPRLVPSYIEASLAQLPVPGENAIISDSTLEKNLRYLRNNLPRAREALSQDDITETYTLLADTMERKLHSKLMGLAAECFGAVPGQPSDEVVAQAVERLLNAIEHPRSPFAIEALIVGLAAMPRPLNASEARRAYATILSIMKLEPQSSELLNLQVAARALKAVPADISPANARQAMDYLLRGVKKKYDYLSLDSILGENMTVILHRNVASSLVWTAGKLSENDARMAFNDVFDAMLASDDNFPAYLLASALTPLGARMSEKDLAETFKDHYTKMLAAADQRALGFHAKAIGAVVHGVSDAEALRIYSALWGKLRTSDLPFSQQLLGESVVAICQSLAASSIEEVQLILLDGMQDAQESHVLLAVSEAFGAIPGTVSPEHSEKAFQILISKLDNSRPFAHIDKMIQFRDSKVAKLETAVLQKTADTFLSVDVLIICLRIIGGEMSPENSIIVFDRLVRELEEQKRPEDVLSAARYLLLVPGKISLAQAERCCELILESLLTLERNKKNKNFSTTTLQSASACLAYLLQSEASGTIREMVLAGTEQTHNPEVFDALVRAFKSIENFPEYETAINLLKFPICVVPARSALLEILERQTGQDFGNKLWKMVSGASDVGMTIEELERPPKRAKAVAKSVKSDYSGVENFSVEELLSN